MELTPQELEQYMLHCISLAKKAPNRVKRPYVGALILSPQKMIVGEGYRSFVDDTTFLLHAERMALNNAGDTAERGTLITTLEPCIQAKKNQVLECCVQLIAAHHIDTVIFGLTDYSPTVRNNAGINYLRGNGIHARQYKELNERIEKELMYRRT